jgi:hypothetical protein
MRRKRKASRDLCLIEGCDVHSGRQRYSEVAMNLIERFDRAVANDRSDIRVEMSEQALRLAES